MKCICCNRTLNDYESTLKMKSTGDYADSCLKCVREIGLETQGRADLEPFAMPDEELGEEWLEQNDDE